VIAIDADGPPQDHQGRAASETASDRAGGSEVIEPRRSFARPGAPDEAGSRGGRRSVRTGYPRSARLRAARARRKRDDHGRSAAAPKGETLRQGPVKSHIAA
jgi:hypothetical protein